MLLVVSEISFAFDGIVSSGFTKSMRASNLSEVSLHHESDDANSTLNCPVSARWKLADVAVTVALPHSRVLGEVELGRVGGGRESEDRGGRGFK